MIKSTNHTIAPRSNDHGPSNRRINRRGRIQNQLMLARAFRADGGIMNADMIGGMMDGNMDEMGRQMYGLGKLVKKATRAVKKIVKSPIGKAAIFYAGAGGLVI